MLGVCVCAGCKVFTREKCVGLKPMVISEE